MKYQFIEDEKLLNRDGIEGILGAMSGPIVPVTKTSGVSHYSIKDSNFYMMEEKGEAYALGTISTRLSNKLQNYGVEVISN